MMKGVKLSKESQTFLENLRIYLFSSGKNENAAEEVIEELEIHLIEAESEGKSIEKIIGKTPKEYMQQLAGEMDVDYSSWFKYIPIIILGAFSFHLFGELIHGELSFSLLEMLGHVSICILFIIAIFGAFKYVSTHKLSAKKQMVIFGLLGIFPILLFMGLIYLNKAIATPVIHFGMIGSMITAIIMLLFVIGVSIWAKSWVFMVFLIILTVPEYLLEQTALQEVTKLMLDSLFIFGGIAIYLFITHRMNKEK